MSWRCFTHDVEYPVNSQCPVCRAEEAAEHRRAMLAQQEEASLDAERRHEESLKQEREQHEAAREHEQERRREAETRARDAEERERTRRQEAEEERLRSADEAHFRQANPGDYECPHCRYQSLRRSASRCPTCQGSISTSYWTPIFQEEREAAEERRRVQRLADEEWKRGEPERQQRARDAAREKAEAQERWNAEHEKARETARRTHFAERVARWQRIYFLFYFPYALPGLAMLSLGIGTNSIDTGFTYSMGLVPGMNWIFLLPLYFDQSVWPPGVDVREVLPLLLLGWSILGILGAVILPRVLLSETEPA